MSNKGTQSDKEPQCTGSRATACQPWPPAWLSRRPESAPQARIDPFDPTVEGAIDIPVDWRWRVASLPHLQWVTWRRRVLEILRALDHKPTADEIRAADRQAAEELSP